MERVTLSEALAEGDLEPFIKQAEAEGVGPVDEAQFESVAERVIKAPQPKGQTSR